MKELEVGQSLQENLLVLLSFDEDHAQLIRSTVDVGMFTGFYRTIAERVYEHLDRFKSPPEDHLSDILEDKLDNDNEREANIYHDIVDSIFDMKDRVNTEYILSQLSTFTERQKLRGITGQLIKELQTDTEESIDRARGLMRSATTGSLTQFNPGTRLDDKDKVLRFLDDREKAFPIGIKEFDRRDLGPARKEMHLYISKRKSGKSFWLTHLAKMSMLRQLKVVHMSLEMGEEKCVQRYMQALFSISKRIEKYSKLKFETDEWGKLVNWDDYELIPSLTFDDPDIRSKLIKKIDKFGTRLLKNVWVKEFPTGRINMRDVETYLEMLELRENFIPDMILVDYPDLFKLDSTNLRLSIDEAYKDLRGLGVEKNMAVAVVSQSNRQSATAKRTRGEGVAEHYGKLAHADVIFTYSQTDAEKLLGLARVSVDGARNDEDGFTVVISQNYGTGQYVIDSAMMVNRYERLLEEEVGDIEESD